MQSKATTVQAYLDSLPADRREALQAVRKVILKNLGKDYIENMSYGMIGYCVPHSVYPAGYHCNPEQALPFAAMASQKQSMSVYLMSVYMTPGELAWFTSAWAKTGKKLDMGKSCIRFKKVEDVALDVLGEAIRRMPAKKYIAQYEQNLATTTAGRKRLAEVGKGTKAGIKKAGVKKKIAKKTAPGRK